MSAAALTIGPGASGAPGVFSLDRLRLGTGGPENYIYTAGNRIVPEGGVDTGAYYRTVVTDGAGVVRNGTAPCLPAAEFETADNSYEVKAGDPVSTAAGWTFSLRQFSTSDCSGSATKTASKVFYVGTATPYNSSAATTVQNSFRAGATAYVAVAGMPRGVSDFNVYWIGPSGAVVCANTAGADRPDADSEGKLPKGGGGVIQYRPGASGQQWNRESNYELRPCANFSSTNEGPWKLRLVLNATNSVDLAAFAVDTTAPAAPVLDGTPPLLSTSATATFAFSGSEPGTSFLCRLDGTGGAVFSPCSTPVTYGGLTDGSHTFEVRAVDIAGNESAVTAFTWTADTSAPQVTLTEPAAGSSTGETPTFAGLAGIAAGDQATVTVKVYAGGIVGGDPIQTLTTTRDGAGAYATSPSSPLGDGTFTAQAEQEDTAGNTGRSGPVTFSVDTAAPETTIDSGPSDPAGSAEATFTFSAGQAGSTFECQLDGGGYSSCTSPKTYTGLADGSHTFQVRATDTAGNTDSTPASYTWTIDAAGPDTSIDSSPPLLTNSQSGTFTFLASEPGSTFACQLDGGGYSACTSPKSYSGLTDGSHTFQVRATDTAGNTDPTPAAFTWTIDSTAPNTTIDSGPPDPSGSAAASFSFSSSETGSAFECQLDGGGYSACTSPKSYSGLADGSHTFQVRATDTAGNTDPTPASYTWTIDTAAPETTINSGPPDPSGSAAASFSFSSSETGSTFECQLDGGGYSSCTSPKSYTGLADGSHTFHVRATDTAGNTDPTPDAFSWAIDASGPETTINSEPPDPSGSAAASFSFSSSEPGSTFACQLDGGGYSSCTSPKSYSGLTDGSHTFQVRATDTTGNTDPTPAAFTWTIDTAAPNTTIDTNPTDPSTSTTASFTFSASEPGSTFACQLDGGGYSACTSPKSYSGLTDGSHTFQVRATDTAGNTDSTPASYTWTIDAAGPDTSIDSSPPLLTNSQSGTFTFLASEPGSTFACQLDGGGYSACTSPKSYSGLTDGSHTFQVRATDTAGNTDATPASFTWTVDLISPQITLTQPAAGATTGATPTFAGQAGTAAGDQTTVTVKIYTGGTATGTPVQTLTTTRAGGGAYSAVATSPLADGTYTARSEQADATGNLGTSSANTFTVSTGAPGGSTYRADVLSDNPSAYWRLGESSGTVAASELGATTNGAYENGVLLDQTGALTGDSNRAARFDGVDDIVTVPHSSALNATNGVTIEAWVKRTKTGAWQNILAKPGNGGTAAQNYALWLNTTNQPVAIFGNGTTSVAAYAPAIDTNWHHIVATYSNATARVYVDGVLKVSSSSNVQLTTNTQPLRIGRTSDNLRIFGGTVDEVAVYPTVLSATRIQAHYTAATSVDTTAPAVTLTTPSDGSVVAPTPTFSGAAGNASGDLSSVTLRIFSGNTTGGQLVQTRTTNASAGSWSVSASPALADGIYTAQAQQADSVGNVGVSAPTTFTVTSADITPPAVTITTPPNGSSGADTTPLYAGGAGTAPGDLATITVNVYLGLTPSGQPLQTYTTSEAGGSWSVQGDTLLDGVYTVRAEQDDAAGNLGLSTPHTFTVGTSYRDDVLSDNPAGYWRLGESSGTVAASELGATTNGSYANGVLLGQTGALTGDSNRAARFDGVDDIVSVAHSSALNATNGVTIEAWVKRTKTGAWQNILAKPGNGAVGAQNYALWINTINQPVAFFGNGNSSVATYAPAIDTNWHHIAATYDETTAKVYIDGVLRASTNSNIQLTANTQPLLIGRTTDNNRIFGGTLDEVAVFPAALSATRIQAHYQKGTAADPVPPVVTLSTPPDGSTTLDTRPHFAGVAEVTASDSSTVTVKIYAGSSATGTPVQILTTTRFTSGTWSVDASSALALGTYTAQAEQADVSGNVGKSAASTFTVAASSPSPDPVLVGAGDIADCTDTGVNQTANLVLGFPDATVQTFGDNAYPHGSASDFANCYDPTWGQFKNRTNPAIGDHEYETPNASGYFNYFADRLAPFGASAQDPLRAYYSYDLGAWHVVVLNAICYEIAGCSVNGQLAWLNADLAAHTNTCTLAVLAAPRWSSGTVHGNNAQMQGYWDSLHANEVDVVVGGDDHVYERFALQDPQGFYSPGHGLRQFTVGTGGGSLYTFGEPKANSEVRYRASYGILRLGLHATSYDWQYVPTSGTFSDTGSDTCI